MLIYYKNHSYCYSVFNLVFILFVASTSVSSAESLNVSNDAGVIKFGPGVHYVNEIVMDKPHMLLEGVGRGITILVMNGGVTANAPDPIIRNLTIVGKGTGIGLRLIDVWAATVENVAIENFKEGLRLELTKKGRALAGGVTKNGWPSSYSKGEHFWGSRVTRTDIRNVHISGDGDGIVLKNHLKNSKKGSYWKPTQDNLHGEFFSATTIWGGHIAVKGRSVFVGDGVWSTKIIGTYMDIAPAGGIEMEYGAFKLTLIGVSLELNSAARKSKAPKILATRKGAKSIEIVGSGLKQSDITIRKK